jgi:ankyrin repeat protein
MAAASSRLLAAALAADQAALRAAIDAGEDIDAWDNHGMTLLLSAVFIGNVDAVRLLLDAGADPNRAHRTSLSGAASSLLLVHGCELDLLTLGVEARASDGDGLAICRDRGPALTNGLVPFHGSQGARPFVDLPDGNRVSHR